jgi:DNA-binding HxlR family transcriptional regulator
MSIDGSAESSGPPSGGMLKLVADERVRMIVSELADGPRQPSQLEQLPGIGHSTLYRRLGELTSVGILLERQLTEFPLRVEYALTEAGRVVVAMVLLTERRVLRKLAQDRAGARNGLGEILRLLAPLSRLAQSVQGGCVFAERGLLGPTLTSVLVAEGGHISLVEEGASVSEAAADVRAAPEAWDDALLSGRIVDLDIAGDRGLAQAVLRAFAAALRS